MLKKLIASALSATFLCSSVMLDRIVDTSIVSDVPLADNSTILNHNEKEVKDGSNGQYDIKATNSLGSYVKNALANQEVNEGVNITNLSNNEKFEITSLDFDNTTGDVTVFSSQAIACDMEIIFINDQTGKTELKLSQPVSVGEYIITKVKADISKLPKYYKVSAQLVDKMGYPLSDSYSTNKYTQKFQEIAATNIYDFEPERVVNLDENAQTNFLVLNEKTIKAESTESQNTLVSADYENNKFVFDNVDNSIKNLQDGDLFYIQPTENDIIAVSVENVSIDGDKATVSGNSDIEDIFDVVKLESSSAKEIKVDTTNTDESITFPDHPGKKEFTYENNAPISFMINNRGLDLPDWDDLKDYAGDFVDFVEDHTFSGKANKFARKLGESIAKGKNPFDLILKNSDDSEKKDLFDKLNELFDDPTAVTKEIGIFEGKASIDFEHHIYFYWFINDIEVEFTLTPKVDAELTLGVRPDDSKTKKQFKSIDETKIGDFLKINENKFDKSGKLGTIELATQIPGVLITMTPKIVLDFSGGLKVTYHYESTFGFKEDGEFKLIRELPEDDDDGEKKAHNIDWFRAGELYFCIELNPGCSLLNENLANAALTIDIGLKAEVTQKLDNILQNYKKYSESENVMKISDYNKNSIHDCLTCFDIQISFVIKFGLEANIGPKKFKPDFEKEITIPLAEYHLSCSGWVDNWADYSFDESPIKFGKGECDNQKYRVVFNLYDEDTGKPILDDLIISIKGLINKSNSAFYCNKGKYTYLIHDGDDIINVGTFTVNDSPKNIVLSFKVETGKYGIKHYKFLNDNTPQKPEATTTKTTQTTKKTTTTTTTTAKHPERELMQQVRLGNTIGALVYKSGYVFVYGYGDMYDYKYSSPFKDVKNIREVYFYDLDPTNGYSITSIGGGVFKGAENLEGIYLSNKITKIGDSAFNGCKNLKWFRYGGFKDTTTTFKLPAELERIGNYAFADCKQFTSITVPNKTIFVGDQAFDGCTALANVVIGKNVKTIGKNAFNMCSSLQSLTLPSADFDMYEADASNPNGGYILNKPTPIYMLFNWYNSNDKFYATSQNKNLFVPKSLKTIKITGGEKIGEKAFRGMYELENITIPSTIKEIGNNAFEDCNKVKKITLPAGLRVIGSSAFRHCDSAVFNTNVIPSSVASIGYDAFAYCKKIETLVIPENTKKIYPSAFYGCENLKRAIIKDGIEILGESMFDECRALTNLTLPSTEFKLQTIGNGVLYSAPVYTLFKCDWNPNSGYYRSYDSHYKVHNALKTITITGGTKINAGAFRGMVSLENIHIPDSITEIGDHAFDECTALTALTLPENLTKIGDSAFRKCYVAEFNTNIIPTKVESIGAYAFENCYTLTSITVPGNVETIGRYAFDGCKNMTSAIIKNGVKTIGENIFDNCTSLKSLSLPFAGLSLDDVNNNDISTPIYHLFKRDWNNCEGFYRSYETEYKVPETLTSITITGGNKIPEGAFRGMKKLTTITLPNTITKICDYAFDDCTGLTKVNVNNSEVNWKKAVIGSYNESLVNAVKTFKTVTISAHPTNISVDCGQTATFKVTAKGDSITYQWQYSIDNGKTWKNTGTSKNTYNIKTTDKQNNYLYRCVITDKYGTKKTSNSAKLTVKPAATTTVTTTAKTNTKTTAKTTTKATTAKTTVKVTAKTTTKATTPKTTAKVTTKATTAKTTVKATTKATTAKTTAKATTKATTPKTTAKVTTKATTAKTTAKVTTKATTATI